MSIDHDLQAQVREIAGKKSSLAVYNGTKRFIQQVLWRLYDVEIVNREGLNLEGGVIYAPVHRSHLDSPLLGAAPNRRLRALAKQSLFAIAPARWYIACLGAFPVERGAADREALRVAQSLLEAGEPLLVFPEGTRQIGDTVGEVFDGVAYLAARANVPVVPIGINGTGEAFPPGAKVPKRTTVTIVVGEPMQVPLSDRGRLTRSGRATFATDLRAELQRLQDQAIGHRA